MVLELQVALIAAFGSLIVATISLVGVIISARQTAKAARSLETLRFELEGKKESRNTKEQLLSESIESLDSMIQAVQHMKDVVRLVVDSYEDSLDKGSARKLLTEGRKRVFESFEQNVQNLAERELSASHEAKNLAYIIEVKAFEGLEKVDFASELPEARLAELNEMRERLSDAQALLRDRKLTRLAKAIAADE